MFFLFPEKIFSVFSPETVNIKILANIRANHYDPFRPSLKFDQIEDTKQIERILMVVLLIFTTLLENFLNQNLDGLLDIINTWVYIVHLTNSYHMILTLVKYWNGMSNHIIKSMRLLQNIFVMIWEKQR